MRIRPSVLLVMVLLLVAQPFVAVPARAASASDTAAAVAAAIREAEACPARSAQVVNTAQTSQSDCCKGHKGVCGCRAGKIVCCDNTVSVSCTCHGDSGLEN